MPKLHSHWWVSPLLTIENPVPVSSQGEEYLRNRVYAIQDQHNELMDLAAQTMVKAVESIEPPQYPRS